MSKSIYEEVLEIIDKNIFELPTGFAVLYEIRKRIEQAQKQAQKQEKLLELYKEYFEYSEMLKDGRKFGGRMLVEHERDKIIKEIKEIENDK